MSRSPENDREQIRAYAKLAADLTMEIHDPKLKHETGLVVSLLTMGDFGEASKRCAGLALKVMQEWRKEVAPPLLFALFIDHIMGARSSGNTIAEQSALRAYRFLLADPDAFAFCLQLASYAEMFAPIAKGEAERLKKLREEAQ